MPDEHGFVGLGVEHRPAAAAAPAAVGPGRRGAHADRARPSRAALLVAALWAFACTPARAEPESSGSWRALFSTDTAERCEAQLVVDIDRGTWTDSPGCRAASDACSGRPLPLTLVGSGSSTVTLSIQASKADRRCADRKARLTVVDFDTLEGEFDDGRVLRLERVR